MKKFKEKRQEKIRNKFQLYDWLKKQFHTENKYGYNYLYLLETINKNSLILVYDTKEMQTTYQVNLNDLVYLRRKKTLLKLCEYTESLKDSIAVYNGNGTNPDLDETVCIEPWIFLRSNLKGLGLI